MTRKSKDKAQISPMELTINIIGGKWKPLILWKISNGVLRFSELQHVLPTITSAMLTKQLRELENDGIVIRKVYPEVPPRVEYSLSELGMTVLPLCMELCEWGIYYNEKIGRLYELKKS